MDKQMEKWVLQSTCDEVFFGMTREEEDERSKRLAYKELNHIDDAEVIASKFRFYKNQVLLYGQLEAEKKITKLILMGML
jgi:hypothetical protein